MVEIFDRELPEFQNISCYCLTATKLQHIGNLQIFQNISCYCLTNLCNWIQRTINISKHLMLLFNKNANEK